MRYVVRHATAEDIYDYVFKYGRKIDIEEALVGGGFKDKNQLYRYLMKYLGTINAAYDKDKLVCIGGYEPLFPTLNVWSVWLLLTNQAEHRPITFLRWAKDYLKTLKKNMPNIVFTNQVYCKNELHMKWLSWMGAEWTRQDGLFDTFIL